MLLKNKIEEYVKTHGKKLFIFSKENAMFLKKICEKQLNIQITSKLISKTIIDMIELQKSMYNKKKAESWKTLYEHLRSYTRIIEYMKYQGCINIPYRDTIRDHIKLYFETWNHNYEEWLKNFPFIQIGLNGSGVFTKFPFEIRNRICEDILSIILDNKGKLQNLKILEILIKLFKKKEDLLLIWMINNPIYSDPLKEHIFQLIFLLRNLYHISSKGETINMTALSYDNRININRRSIKKIIDNLVEKGLLII